MIDRTTPTRTRHHRRLLAVGSSALTVALVATACSAAGHAAAAPGFTARPSSAPTQVGYVDTNPADPPQVQPPWPKGSPVPTNYRGIPAAHQLDIAWSSTAWLSEVHAAAGKKVKANDWQTPAAAVSSWDWSTPQVGELEAGISTQLPSGLPQPYCSAETFEPASSAAASQITNTMLLCAQTGLSAGSAPAAEAWIRKQIPTELADVNGLTDGREVVSATPAFGSTTYYIYARYISGYGYLIEMLVW